MPPSQYLPYRSAMQVQPYRQGWQAPLEQGSLDVAGVRRTYWLARASARGSPLLIVLHGYGMDGRAMAELTGLGARGPAAGFTVAFPDGWKGDWYPGRAPAKEPALDDALFLRDLSYQIEYSGAARSWPVFLAGMASGAACAEHLARHGYLPVAVLFLVAGSALDWSRHQIPVPTLRATAVCVAGTGDPLVPYWGGPASRGGGPLRRRAARQGPGESAVAGAVATVKDWAAGNGISAPPAIREIPVRPGEIPVTLLSWGRPNCRPVTLFRVEGGGHCWPGGRPGRTGRTTRAVGPFARNLDATGILLNCAEQAGAPISARRAIMR
jgi:polyhydroxybutyrate depolymerase